MGRSPRRLRRLLSVFGAFLDLLPLLAASMICSVQLLVDADIPLTLASPVHDDHFPILTLTVLDHRRGKQIFSIQRPDIQRHEGAQCRETTVLLVPTASSTEK